MDFKRRNMERINVVDVSLLHEADFTFKEAADHFSDTKFCSLVQKYGQWQNIVTATVNGVLLVVDGAYILRTLKKLGIGRANTFHLGELSRKEYVIVRLALTSKVPRLNYIEIAKAITEICTSERDRLQIANATHIPYEDVKYYEQLLTFDWEAFLKAPEVDAEQLNMFNDER
jgi:hypothetical protein